jgi:hypothetical protein
MMMLDSPTAPPRSAGSTVHGPSLPSRVPVRDRVSRRLRTPASRALDARTLAQLVEDASIVDACAPLPHLQRALDGSISAASEAAVDALVDGLADLLDQLPDSALDSWDRACLAADLGYE